MSRPTMFDEYGRCIHCGFWHADLDSPAAQACGEHEAMYRDRPPLGTCGCVFKTLPRPVMGKDGLWHAPGSLKPEEVAPPAAVVPVDTGGRAIKDFVCAIAPAKPWWKRLLHI